jgi:DNA-binding response OmpR family regulator
VTSRTVDGHVAALRHKLEADPRAPRHLVTVYKAGYRLQR